MSSVIVPGLDLAPNVPSRIVTVDVIDMTEGQPAAGAQIDFILPQDLHARSDGKVLKAGTTTLTLDSAGHGEIRLPAYSSATQPEDWVILVKKHWAPYPYPIRVPTGTTKLSLAALTPPLEVNTDMTRYLITDAAATITEGAQWGVDVDVTGNVVNFDFTAPPGGEAWAKGALTDNSDLASLTEGAYRVASLTVADALNLPVRRLGALEVLRGGSTALGLRTFRFTTDSRPTGDHPLEVWELATDNTGAITTDWRRVYPPEAVTSPTINEIITSPNYTQDLNPGQLLIVTPPPEQWFTDFGDDTLNVTPSGWTPKWGAPATPWRVVADPTVPNGRVLRAENTGDDNRTALAWTAIGDHADIEIVVKYKASQVAASARPTARGTGGIGTETGTYTFTDGSTLNPVLARLLNGTLITTPGSEGKPFDYQSGAWFIARYRIVGTQTKVKQWAAHLPEPDAWNQEWTVGAVADAGWVGFQRSTNGRIDIDWVGVATGGGLAPTKAE